MPIRWSGSQNDPISIILVSKGTKGDRLLFKYPFYSELDEEKSPRDGLQETSILKSSFALRKEDHRRFLAWKPELDYRQSLLEDGRLTRLSDDIMAYQFTVKQELAQQRFEVKINDVRFVGFPVLTPVMERSKTDEDIQDDEELPGIHLFSVVIAVHAAACKSIVTQYQDLSKRIGLAIEYEEKRCGYLSRQGKYMNECLEEAQHLPEPDQAPVSPYLRMLEISELACSLKLIFEEITERGSVSVRFNNWVQVSFCIPQKVHEIAGIPPCSPSLLEEVLDCLRPYHSVLLIEDAKDILSVLPVDSSPSLIRFIQHATPLKSIQTLSMDLDLALPQICLLVRHLVVWGKAIPVFPLCESNVYTVSENTNIHSFSLNENFAETFPGQSLLGTLAEFSPSLTLGEFTGSLNLDPLLQKERVKMVMWLLRRCILIQLHTYIYLCQSYPALQRKETANITGRSSDLLFARNDEDQPTIILPNNSNLLDCNSTSELKLALNENDLLPAIRQHKSPNRKTSLSANYRFGFAGTSLDSQKFVDKQHEQIQKLIDKQFLSLEEELVQLRKQLKPSALMNSVENIVKELVETDRKPNVLSRKVVEENNNSDIKETIRLFSKLCKYFDGNFPLEEIMYRENLRRKDCLRVLDVFSRVLVTVTRPDTLALMLSPPTAVCD